MPEPTNPYEAPRVVLDEPGGRVDIPPSFAGKFGLTFRLFFGNLPRIVAVVLTVWLPANLALEFALASDPGSVSALFRMNSLLESVFGPPVTGAVVWLLSETLEGRRSTYGAAMRVGLRNWGRIFAARWFAALYILVGFLALIVPGIVLTVRYALIDPVVVLEGAARPRERSAELVRGRAWSIALAWGLSLCLVLPLGFGLGALPELVPGLDRPGFEVAAYCVTDVVLVLAQVLLLVYYCEARRREAGDRDANADDMFFVPGPLPGGSPS